MKSFKLYLAGAVLLCAMALPNFSDAGVHVRVRIASPAPRVVVAKPKPHCVGAVWVAGRWNWNGKKYVWIDGRYVDPRPGFVWVDGHWKRIR